MILLRHCVQALFENSSLFMRIMNIISPVGVPLFFAVSGFLFFQKKRDSEDLRKYVWRVLRLYLVWSVIYFPIVLLSYYKRNMLNVTGIVDYLQQFIFSGSYYHLWYLPSLITAIVLIYFISNRIDNKKLFVISVVLFIVGTLVGTYSHLSPLFSWSAYRKIFLTTRNGLFFGFPFVTIGKIIAENRYKTRYDMMLLSILVMFVEGFYLAFIVKKPIVNMSISSLFFVPMVLILVINLRPLKVNGQLLRKASTLIFCVHPLVIVFVGHFIKGLTGTLTVLIVTVICSLIAVKLSERNKAINLLI